MVPAGNTGTNQQALCGTVQRNGNAALLSHSLQIQAVIPDGLFICLVQDLVVQSIVLFAAPLAVVQVVAGGVLAQLGNDVGNGRAGTMQSQLEVAGVLIGKTLRLGHNLQVNGQAGAGALNFRLIEGGNFLSGFRVFQRQCQGQGVDAQLLLSGFPVLGSLFLIGALVGNILGSGS